MGSDLHEKRRSALGVWLAPVLTALAFVASGVAVGTHPFGSTSRNMSDLGTQIVPQHVHLWDLLHGAGPGDLLFNWRSGFGVPSLPDFGVYLSSPFALLVGLFPRDQVDLAVYLITVLKLAVAATAMAVYLIRMRPGPSWLAGVLGASYGLCGWAIDEAAYAPMWLDGLIAFPLFCLAGEWSLRRQRMPLAIAVFAVFWFANFYTAYMATIGAGVVLLVRLLTSDLTLALRLRVLLRHALTVAIGVALTAPLLLPVIKANGIAQPAPPGTFRPIAADLFLSRLLPMAEGVGAGARIFVGTAALLLAVTLPLNKSVPIRTRLIWTSAGAALAVSFQWTPASLVWHGFDAPNGNPYRQAFVLCGVLVIAGWLSVAHGRPSPLAVGGAAVVVAGLAVTSRGSPYLNRHSVTLLALSAALVGLAVLAMSRVAVLTVMLLAVTVFAEGSLSAVEIHRDRARFWRGLPVWNGDHAAIRSAVGEADGWPRYRTDPGSGITPNDPLQIGGQGGSYYSSLLPASLSRTLSGLGFASSGYGRSLPRLDHPVVDVLFSVGVKLRDGTPHRSAVPPLVTVRPAQVAHPADTAYARHEALLGSRLYQVPQYRITPIGPQLFRLDATCRAGSVAYLDAPFAVGSAQLTGGAPVGLLWRKPRPGAGHGGLAELGTVPPTGAFSVTLRLPDGPAGIASTGAIGCLDPGKLRDAVTRLRAAGAAEVRAGGHSIEARLARPTQGIAVIAVPQLPGWQCARDSGRWQQPDSFGGLLAVPLTEPTSRIDCRYRPPGLGLGLAICGVAAMITVGLALGSRRTVA